jgi:hypothetical protein
MARGRAVDDAAPAALAQGGPAPGTAEDEIVVTARLSGAPIWEVRQGRATILLVGEIAEVPEATPWRPRGLEVATARASRVILGVKTKISPGDLFRLLFRGGRLKRLPEGRTIADYLPPQQQRRLARLAGRKYDDYTQQNLLLTAFDLLTGQLRFNRDTTDDATEIVRKAARRAKIPARPVGTVRGEDLLDSLFSAAPETNVPCLQSAMAAVESGAEGVLRRGRDWTQFDVPGVMASPIEIALGRCWPWADDRFGPQLRQQWADAIDGALGQPDVTLGVVPLRFLAEKQGLLDRLKARGAIINGPAWRRAGGPDR